MQNELRNWLDEKVDGERKPLYLSGGGALTVELDGPTLRIRQDDQAAMLYPLARVGRVISRGSVKWETEALLACAKSGIPVIFQLHDSCVCGFLFGWSGYEDGLFRAVQGRLGRPAGAKVYRGWRQAMTDRALMALLKQWPEIAGACSNTEDWQRELAKRYQQRITPDDYVAMTARLRVLLGALSAELLMGAGIDAVRMGRMGVMLLGDLVGLLAWALHTPFIQALSGSQGESAFNPTDDRQLVGLFEAQAADLWRFGQSLLRELQQCLEAT